LWNQTFRGSFEDAKECALNKDIWLMVNVQSAAEFASHQLNCDTFSNDALKEMIKANFVFLQTYNDGATGKKLMNYYHLEQFPCILIIDPITGELMQNFKGFVEPDRLIEDLVEYMDCSPKDSSASQLLRRLHKGKGSMSEAFGAQNAGGLEESSKNKTEDESFRTSDPSDEEPEMEDLEAEEYLTQMHKSSGGSGQTGIVHEPVPSPVPQEAGFDTCTVGIMLPNGTRLQRLFFKHDKVENVYAFCNMEFEEARSRPYKLKPRMPGSQPLEDLSLSLESAQIQDSLLAFIWSS